MAASTSLYRKYRSPNFDELVGQEPVVRTLKNAIASGRISHAYLFTGPRGVGKTSAARLLARAANCLSEGTDKPCNKCPNCLAATRDIATDLIEIDAASNTGVDNIREVIEKAQFSPSVWNRKFYVIDEAHMLSVSAFNALLKTLEEPPPHTTFVLATTEVHKVPATVASRCQRFDFRRVPLPAMLARLQYICAQEGIEAETPALELVARQATGSLRDALSLLDQLRVYSEKGDVTLASVQEMLGASGSEEVASFVDELVAGDLGAGLRRINAVIEEGLDLRQFNRQLVEHLRGLMLVKSGATGTSADNSLLDVTAEMKARIVQQAARVVMPDLLRWVGLFAEADADLRSTTYRQLPLEMALVAATLKPEQAAAPLQVREHAADIAAGAAQIAVPPRQRPTPMAQSDARRPELSAPPPPIHSELGSIGAANEKAAGSRDGNGVEHHLSGDRPRLDIQPSKPTPSDEISEASGGEGSAAANVPPEEQAHAEGDQLERLRRLWPQVVDQIKARSPAIAGVFRDPNLTRPFSVVGPACTISFRDPIHVTRSRLDKQREIIEQALGRVLGYPCRLESITFAEAESGHDGDVGNAPDAGTKPSKPSPYDTTRGKAAMNIFNIDRFDDPK